MFSSVFKFSYPPEVVQSHSSTPSPLQAPAETPLLQPDHMYDICMNDVLSVDPSAEPKTYSEVLEECHQPEYLYGYNSFDAEHGWVHAPLSPESDDTGDYRRSKSRDSDNVDDLSPTSACFPADLSNYASHQSSLFLLHHLTIWFRYYEDNGQQGQCTCNNDFTLLCCSVISLGFQVDWCNMLGRLT